MHLKTKPSIDFVCKKNYTFEIFSSKFVIVIHYSGFQPTSA